MFKHFRVLLCVCGLLSALAGPANAVSYTIDSGGGVAPVYNNLENLRGVLLGTLANNDSITLLNSDASLTGEFTLAGGFALTLANGAAGGAPLTISAASPGTRFLNAAGAATITWGTGLTFSGFESGAGDPGGAVYVGGNLTGGINDSTFTSNSAEGFGGALFVGGDLTDGIANSTFTSNTASGSGGALFVGGDLTDGIANSTFTSNTASGSGGAVYVNSDLSGGISGSTFEDNTATNGLGGAMAVLGDLTGGINDSTFTSNSAEGFGGALFVGGRPHRWHS